MTATPWPHPGPAPLQPSATGRAGPGRLLALLGQFGAGFAAVVGLWWLASATGTAPVPSPAAVALAAADPVTRAVVVRALAATAPAAAAGYVAGLLAALLSGLWARLFPAVGPGLSGVAFLSSAIPIVAVGPVLGALLPPQAVPVISAALAVYFAAFVVVLHGFAAVPEVPQQLATVLLAGRFRRLWCIDLPAAAPGILLALKYGFPAAVLGAVVGEWFGSPSGAGVVMLSAMRNLQHELLWCTAVAVAALSMAGYGLLSVAHDRVAREVGGFVGRGR